MLRLKDETSLFKRFWANSQKMREDGLFTLANVCDTTAARRLLTAACDGQTISVYTKRQWIAVVLQTDVKNEASVNHFKETLREHGALLAELCRTEEGIEELLPLIQHSNEMTRLLLCNAHLAPLLLQNKTICSVILALYPGDLEFESRIVNSHGDERIEDFCIGTTNTPPIDAAIKLRMENLKELLSPPSGSTRQGEPKRKIPSRRQLELFNYYFHFEKPPQAAAHAPGDPPSPPLTTTSVGESGLAITSAPGAAVDLSPAPPLNLKQVLKNGLSVLLHKEYFSHYLNEEAFRWIFEATAACYLRDSDPRRDSDLEQQKREMLDFIDTLMLYGLTYPSTPTTSRDTPSARKPLFIALYTLLHSPDKTIEQPRAQKLLKETLARSWAKWIRKREDGIEIVGQLLMEISNPLPDFSFKPDLVALGKILFTLNEKLPDKKQFRELLTFCRHRHPENFLCLEKFLCDRLRDFDTQSAAEKEVLLQLIEIDDIRDLLLKEELIVSSTKHAPLSFLNHFRGIQPILKDRTLREALRSHMPAPYSYAFHPDTLQQWRSVFTRRYNGPALDTHVHCAIITAIPEFWKKLDPTASLKYKFLKFVFKYETPGDRRQINRLKERSPFFRVKLEGYSSLAALALKQETTNCFLLAKYDEFLIQATFESARTPEERKQLKTKFGRFPHINRWLIDNHWLKEEAQITPETAPLAASVATPAPPVPDASAQQEEADAITKSLPPRDLGPAVPVVMSSAPAPVIASLSLPLDTDPAEETPVSPPPPNHEGPKQQPSEASAAAAAAIQPPAERLAAAPATTSDEEGIAPVAPATISDGEDLDTRSKFADLPDGAYRTPSPHRSLSPRGKAAASAPSHIASAVCSFATLFSSPLLNSAHPLPKGEEALPTVVTVEEEVKALFHEIKIKLESFEVALSKEEALPDEEIKQFHTQSVSVLAKTSDNSDLREEGWYQQYLLEFEAIFERFKIFTSPSAEYCTRIKEIAKSGLLLLCHPDRGGNEEAFKNIQKKYQQLTGTTTEITYAELTELNEKAQGASKTIEEAAEDVSDFLDAYEATISPVRPPARLS